MLPGSKITGDIVHIFNNGNWLILIIITKNKDKQSSAYENVYTSLINLKQFCDENNINKLAMNKPDQNDNLQWDKIRSMSRYTIRSTNIEIIIRGTR